MPGEYNVRQMQEEAIRRAREMQSRARVPAPSRGREAPSPPPEEPAPPEPERLAPETEPASAPVQTPVSQERRPGLLESLFQDQERTLILALLILLSGEEDSNHELLFALMFLLL